MIASAGVASICALVALKVFHEKYLANALAVPLMCWVPAHLLGWWAVERIKGFPAERALASDPSSLARATRPHAMAGWLLTAAGSAVLWLKLALG